MHFPERAKDGVSKKVQTVNRLRDYQEAMKGRIRAEWMYHRSVLVQMPTGTGKTHLLAAVVRDVLAAAGEDGAVWIIAHRRELVEQIEETVASHGMRVWMAP